MTGILLLGYLGVELGSSVDKLPDCFYFTSEDSLGRLFKCNGALVSIPVDIGDGEILGTYAAANREGVIYLVGLEIMWRDLLPYFAKESAETAFRGFQEFLGSKYGNPTKQEGGLIAWRLYDPVIQDSLLVGLSLGSEGTGIYVLRVLYAHMRYVPVNLYERQPSW